MRINHLVLAGLLAFFLGSTFAPQAKSLVQAQTFDLTIQYVEGVPDESGLAYNVDVYLTLLDEMGNPVKGLTTDSFNVQEEEGGGQKVDIQTVSDAKDRPINLVLVMDTSRSMDGARITDTKTSAASFFSNLIGPDDQAAVMIFDDVVGSQVSFTNDPETLTSGINRINATREAGGACLYDAAFSAVEILSKQPASNRAVILFTDSKDETLTSRPCSKHTLKDVTTLATDGRAHTPIYTFGLGPNIDEEALKAIADQTGGLYMYIPDSAQIANSFQMLEDRLQSQYVIRYSSSLSPGLHTLTISLNQLGQVFEDKYDFLLPSLPTQIKFLSPNDGDTVSGQLQISVSLTAPTGTSIDRVDFLVNGAIAGSDETKPYEIGLDTTQLPAGAMTISAIAYDRDNKELAKNTLNLMIEEPIKQIVPSPAVETQNSPTPAPAITNNPIALLAIIISGLSIVSISLLIFFLLRQQKQSTILAVETFIENKPMPSSQGIPVYHPSEEEKIKSKSETQALGALTIQASDDTSLIGQRFEINAPLITLGRSADNDLNFPNDKPVSRHHAEIYQISGKLYLRQVEMADASGTAKPPTYGTYLNKTPLATESVALKTGDDIQLGKRVRLKFESYSLNIDANMMTMDDNDLTNPEDIDKTQMQ